MLNGLEMLFFLSLSPGSRWCKFVPIFSQMQSLTSHDLTLPACCGVPWLRSRLVYRSRRAECNSSKVFVYDNSPRKACGTLFSFLVARSPHSKSNSVEKICLWRAMSHSDFTCEWKSWLWIYFSVQLSRSDKNFYWVEFSEWMTARWREAFESLRQEASLGKCSSSRQTIVKLFTRKTILALKIHNKYGERDEWTDCVSLSTPSLWYHRRGLSRHLCSLVLIARGRNVSRSPFFIANTRSMA